MKTLAKEKGQPKPLTSVMEDYLEAIFDLDKSQKVVRVRDIAGKLEVKMPTVTSMLKTLSGRGLVHYEKYGYVELTPRGSRIGRKIHHRHEILYRFLTEILNVPPQTAEDEACKMEHTLGGNTLERLINFMTFFQQCPTAGESWLKQFQRYQQDGQLSEACMLSPKKSAKAPSKTPKTK